MIDPKQFNGGPALSRANQPNVAELLRAVGDGKHPVTFIVGAGVAMESGFPSWRGLVRKISDKIGDYRDIPASTFVNADGDDLMRKAEYVIRLYIEKEGTGVPKEVVRTALYGGAASPTVPGPVSISLANLIRDLLGRVRIITTNYDDVLETALADIGVLHRAYSATEVADWDAIDWAAPPDFVPVMHAHGKLTRDGVGDLGDPVLTESDFLKQGPEVRRMITNALETSVTVFIGLSMTDPNLVGPLWDTQNSRLESFPVSVPSSLGLGETISEARTYAILKSGYLESVLKTKPVVLKSYSQLDQLLRECQVASRDLARYFSDDPATSTAYGFRLSSILARCHSGAVAPSEPLASHLEPTGLIGEFLQRHGRTKDVRARVKRLQKECDDDLGAPEEFGLLLWLRGDDPDAEVPYAIRVVGSSHFGLEGPMARFFQNVAVEPKSDHTASRAIWADKGQIWNVKADASLGVWRGVYSAPLRAWEKVAFGAHDLDMPTTVGAVSLLTTHTVIVSDEPKPKGLPISILNAFDTGQRVELLRLVERSARRTLGLIVP